MSMLCCTGYLILFFVIYKILDRLLRLFYIGKYNERYILVTGCDMGFGNILAKRLDRLGCHVFAACLTESGGAALKSQCSQNLQVLNLDVSNQESVQKAFDIVKATLPAGQGLWGVMNNAGVVGTLGPVDWLSVKDFKECSAINLYGLIDVTITFLPLIKRGRGRVVNTASVFGRYSLTVASPYCVSKYGVDTFTDSLRRSMIPFGVKAILIEPGIHKTNIVNPQNTNPQGEKAWRGAPEEVKEQYGEEYHKYFVSAGLSAFDDMASPRVDDVVDAYQHALLGTFPRARYLVGFDANFIWMPMQWMPEWLGDWLITKFDKKQPLPAAVLKKDQ
jgi:NAD(P)-dependent dehydrogenase (short-subunit alcohol dehydrogenase family)